MSEPLSNDDVNKIETLLGELEHCSMFYLSRKDYLQNLIAEAKEWVEEIKQRDQLSKVFQLERKEAQPAPHKFINTHEDYCEGYNQCVSDIDQLSPDANKLAEIITEVKQHELYDLNLSSQYLAKQIINKMNVWIVKPLIEPHSIGRETDEKYIVDIDKAIEETLKRASGETK